MSSSLQAHSDDGDNSSVRNTSADLPDCTTKSSKTHQELISVKIFSLTQSED
jgi:hypothetical protein